MTIGNKYFFDLPILLPIVDYLFFLRTRDMILSDLVLKELFSLVYMITLLIYQFHFSYATFIRDISHWTEKNVFYLLIICFAEEKKRNDNVDYRYIASPHNIVHCADNVPEIWPPATGLIPKIIQITYGLVGVTV